MQTWIQQYAYCLESSFLLDRHLEGKYSSRQTSGDVYRLESSFLLDRHLEGKVFFPSNFRGCQEARWERGKTTRPLCMIACRSPLICRTARNSDGLKPATDPQRVANETQISFTRKGAGRVTGGSLRRPRD